jgi:hypothetical protein
MSKPKVFIKVNEKGCRIGDSHPRAVLTDHEVDLLMELLICRDEIIEHLEAKGCSRSVIDATLCEEQLSYRWLAIKFEVHVQCIAKINRGERRCQRPAAYKPVPVKAKI